MISFAFKNVILFVMIIIIVHVLLKNAILERDRARIAAGDGSTQDTSKASASDTAAKSSDVEASFKEGFSSDTKELTLRDDRRRAAEEALAALHKKSDEEDMMRYVFEGDGDDDEDADMITTRRATPALTSSWNAHRLSGDPAAVSASEAALALSSQPSQPRNLTQDAGVARTASDTPDAVNARSPGFTPAFAKSAAKDAAEQDGGVLGGLKGANAFDTNFQTFD